ncbi:disease resistance protein Roq1-like [Rosa rugosa]|uniref:disease resistance protein Roq1-like n=1 Tax=Rosa rugosa TaxID=74645 RepID=UPI002B40EC2C|nr:disease resistance protein Roq1-like [Rosa rugosa]
MTFAADRDLEVGTTSSPKLLKAIQRSRISVIVMSGSYAFSGWCLNELLCIMESWRREDRLVLPIFYNVDPSDVRKQKGGFGEALEEHHRSGRIEQTTMLKWREALTQVANICGWDTKKERHSELVYDIVKSIQSKGLPTRLNISIYPLRYDTCDEYLKGFLQLGSQEVVIVGICGPGQMGKRAMARVMYDQILQNFDGGCFLADVGQRSNQPNYLVHLQETLLSEILSERNVKISDTRMGIDLIAQNLCSKRVLVVLDNVDHLSQIYALVGDCKFFGPGSKIIITTRDVQLLNLFGVDQFILAHGRPLPENVGAIWEPYQRSRCIVAGIKEYIETFNQQRRERLKHLQAVFLQERQKNATQERLILESCLNSMVRADADGFDRIDKLGLPAINLAKEFWSPPEIKENNLNLLIKDEKIGLPSLKAA